MPRRVIIPLDGTESAEAALAFIERWQNKEDLEVLLISVWEADENILGEDHVSRMRTPKILECITSNLSLYLAQAEARLERKGIHVRCQVLPGQPSRDLQALAEKEGADVIITGPRGTASPRCSPQPLPRWCRGPCPIPV